MRRVMRIAAIALSVMLALGTVCSFGTVDKNKKYGYTVTFYAGLQGHFGDDADKKTIVLKDIPAGTSITIDLNELDLVVDNNEYYAKGLRQTGHDNDEYKDINSKTITVDEDMAFEVAYGIAGGMVKYVVNYVDKDGAKLHESNTYYGMIGDKPVVSYKYVQDYLPDAYNKGKTLKKDESKNVFNFTYTYTGKTDNGGNDNDNGGNNNGGNAANNAGGNGTAAGANAVANADGNNTANVADNDTPQAAPKNYQDLDDSDTPLGTFDGQEEESNTSKLPFVIGGLVGALILAILAALLLRRRREE